MSSNQGRGIFTRSSLPLAFIISTPDGGISGAQFHTAEKPVSLAFEAKAGEVMYLGNLHAALAKGKGLFGVTIAFDARAVIRDRASEDIPLAESRTPAIAGKLKAELLPLGLWSANTGTSENMHPLSVPVPPK